MRNFSCAYRWTFPRIPTSARCVPVIAGGSLLESRLPEPSRSLVSHGPRLETAIPHAPHPSRSAGPRAARIVEGKAGQADERLGVAGQVGAGQVLDRLNGDALAADNDGVCRSSICLSAQGAEAPNVEPCFDCRVSATRLVAIVSTGPRALPSCSPPLRSKSLRGALAN